MPVAHPARDAESACGLHQVPAVADALHEAVDLEAEHGGGHDRRSLAQSPGEAGEPDLILAVETKDYLTNAQQLAVQKKFEKFMAQDTHQLDTGMGERKVMRKLAGGMELQELKLK